MEEIRENAADGGEDRRKFLISCGRFALTVPPAMTVLLSTSLSSPAIAQSVGGGGRPKGNNGVGNGIDPQPPGNPPINDGPGTGPGNPGNRGGAGKNKMKFRADRDRITGHMARTKNGKAKIH